MNTITSIEEARNEIKIIERKLDQILKIQEYDLRLVEKVKLDLFTNASALIWVPRNDIKSLLNKTEELRLSLNNWDVISYLENIQDENEYYKGYDAYRSS